MVTQNRFFKIFLYSTAVLLLLTAAAKVYSATGTARILTATDPLVHLAYGRIMVAVGAVEAAVAAYLLIGSNAPAKIWLVLWLGSNFMMYRLANDLLHIKLCPCLGTIGGALPLSRGQLDFLLTILVLYLLFGSTFVLLSGWSRGRSESRATGRVVRAWKAAYAPRSDPQGQGVAAASSEPQPPGVETDKSLDFRS